MQSLCVIFERARTHASLRVLTMFAKTHVKSVMMWLRGSSHESSSRVPLQCNRDPPHHVNGSRVNIPEVATEAGGLSHTSLPCTSFNSIMWVDCCGHVLFERHAAKICRPPTATYTEQCHDLISFYHSPNATVCKTLPESCFLM